MLINLKNILLNTLSCHGNKAASSCCVSFSFAPLFFPPPGSKARWPNLCLLSTQMLNHYDSLHVMVIVSLIMSASLIKWVFWLSSCPVKQVLTLCTKDIVMWSDVYYTYCSPTWLMTHYWYFKVESLTSKWFHLYFSSIFSFLHDQTTC